MNKSILHTPEGVRDIYNEENEKREIILGKLCKLVRSYGFYSIKTPSFEFLNVYYKDTITKKPNDLYKFFDNEGNTLVLRPDFTPSIARAATKYFTDDKIVRLFYSGSVFANNQKYQGRLKETSQFGGELIGDASIDADAEIVSLVVDALKSCKLGDFMISIGHSAIIKELFELGNFNNDDFNTITKYIKNRNTFDLKIFLDEKGCDDNLSKLFTMVIKMYEPDSTEWKELIDYSKEYKTVYDSLNYLNELYELLKVYDVNCNIVFEPARDSEFDYYTGIIFAGYTKGIGEPVATGGRYDNLLANFGKDRPAIGFGIFIEELQQALDKQNIILPTKYEKTIILYNYDKHLKAIDEASKMRKEGKFVELIPVNDNFDEAKKLYENDNVSFMEIK
ncbi:MAG: ATP phosphoribosyltransferase regulatory subunit [Lachnospiraceae bacterium]|nr:ATP phosphoribosyltransferase regulatory subunit [Lachnospiraceae bacterium]